MECHDAIMNPRIEINPKVCHGKPVIRGTRVLVSTLLGALGGGDSRDTVLEDYPNVSAERTMKGWRTMHCFSRHSKRARFC
jgi:uncharacterized protein (DUF433 family)